LGILMAKLVYFMSIGYFELPNWYMYFSQFGMLHQEKSGNPDEQHSHVHTRGRCYDHNFLRFSTIFGEKIGVFLKNQCYD
jgi:hypothetical protein